MSTNTQTLAERAMLVSLRMSCWLPGTVDRAITEKVAADYSVSARRAGSYRKYVIDPDTPSYRAVRRALGDLRTRYYWHTLPWAHHGARILPAVSFAQYSDDMRKLSGRFTDAVDAFTGEWPRLTTLAVAQTNGLVKESDFPADIRARFGVDLQVMPIPTVGDFRVSMSDADAAALKAQMELGVQTQIREALALAAREPYERLYKHVARMTERLSNPDASFHDTLVTGLRDLCAMLPAMNLTDDAQLDALRDLADKMVANVTPAQLRDVPVIRERVAKDAEQLKQLIAPHIADTGSAVPESDEVTRAAAGIEATMGSFMAFGVNGSK